MATHAMHDTAEPPQPRCWCCGVEARDNELVHLGNHPEVGICPGCAHWVHRRATQLEDEQHPTTAARARAVVHGLRAIVVKRGWHRRGVLGALLRRIDRHLP